MGRTVITPPVAGETCAICWGAGKAFGSGPTPSVVTVIFAGIEKGDLWVPDDGDPPNGSYRLEQGVSCTFSKSSGDIFIEWKMQVSNSSLFFSLDFVPAFSSAFNDPCVLEYVNELAFLSSHFYNGTAKIYI